MTLHGRTWVLRWALVALCLLGVSGPARTARADVRSAYQREFAFLEAEKHALQQRIERQRREAAETVETAREDIERLQGQVLSLSVQAERLAETLTDVEREVDRAGEDEDVFSTLLTQMQSTLDNGNVTLPALEKDSPEAPATQLEAGFQQALTLLEQYASVRRETGEFFGSGGQKVSGDIVRVGRVASFGVAAEAAGALAPAGDGRLKVWPQGDTATAARALAQGNAPELLPLFLYESLEQGVEVKKDKSALEVIESGGVIGWVIVGAGALAMLMALARALLLWRSASNTTGLVERITPMLEQKEFDAAIEVCRDSRSSGGRVIVATLKNLHRDRAELEDIVSEAVLHEQPTLDRFGSSILVVAAVAPLLGLLGTVTGMIATFDIITEFGTGNPKLLSSGISIALVTTELGLIVAIPALVVGNLLSGWAERIKDGMDQAALRVVNIASGARLARRPSTPPESNPIAGDTALAVT